MANPICPQPISMGFEEYPPFHTINSKGQKEGIDIELIKQALTELNCKMTFLSGPWQRQLIEFENGNIDIISSANKTTEREVFGRFYTPYMKALTAMFIHNKNSKKYSFKKIEDIVELDKFNLGVCLGYEYGNRFSALKKNNENFRSKLKEFPTESKLIDNFTSANSKIDAFLGDLIVVPFLLKGKKLDKDISIYPATVDDASFVYYMFNKKTISDELGKKINDKVNELIKNGYFEKIASKYIPQDYIKLIKVN